MNLKARTMALASACVVLGYFLTKATEAYRVAAGIGPPNTVLVSFKVRVSAITLISFFCSSMAMTGSRLAIASIWPERISDNAPEAAPTPMNDTSVGFRPALANTKLAMILVDEPGAVTPIFLPLSSAMLLLLGMVLLLTASTICGARPCKTKATIGWFLV